MKIAIISDTLLTGGAERQMLLTAAELTRAGHTVKMVIYYPSHIEFEEFIQQNNIEVMEIKARGFLRIGRILAISKFFRREKFDIVHAFKGVSTISAALAAKLAGTKTVIGGFRVEYKEGRKFTLATWIVDKLIKCWIVNSRAIADSMVKIVGIKPEKFFVVYNGIPLEAFNSSLTKEQARQKLGIAENLNVVTKVARLHPQKNHRMLLQVASKVLQSHSTTFFLVVGDGPLEDDLKAYCTELGLNDSVRFLGNRSDIADILAATDVAALTSDSEGFPNALIEAMAASVPVVTTAYPGVEELIENGKQGLVAPCDNASTFAEQVCRLLDDEKLCSEIVQNASSNIQQNFTPKAMAQNMLEVYNKCLANSK